MDAVRLDRLSEETPKELVGLQKNWSAWKLDRAKMRNNLSTTTRRKSKQCH